MFEVVLFFTQYNPLEIYLNFCVNQGSFLPLHHGDHVHVCEIGHWYYHRKCADAKGRFRSYGHFNDEMLPWCECPTGC